MSLRLALWSGLVVGLLCACGSRGDDVPDGGPAVPGLDGSTSEAAVASDAAIEGGGDAVVATCANTESDPMNCGRCGHVCLPGSTCSSRRCSPAVVSKACPEDPGDPTPSDPGACANLGPSSVAVSDTDVFWGLSKVSEAAILTAPKAGGTTRILFDADRPRGLGVQAGRLYFAESWGARVTSVTLDGGSPVTLGGENSPRNLWLDGAHAVWISTGATGSTSAIAFAPRTLAGAATHVVIDGYVNDVASDGTTIYFSNYDAQAIQALPFAGGPVTNFATGQPGPWCVITTATDVLWGSVDGATGARAIMRAPKSGGPPVVFAAGVAGPMTTDGNALYFVDDASQLQRQDFAGGPAFPLALARLGGVSCRDLAVDGEAVYWADSLAEMILKVAR